MRNWPALAVADLVEPARRWFDSRWDFPRDAWARYRWWWPLPRRECGADGRAAHSTRRGLMRDSAASRATEPCARSAHYGCRYRDPRKKDAPGFGPACL